MKPEKKGDITIKYIVFVNQDLKDIDHRRKHKDDLVIQELSISSQNTVYEMINEIKKRERIPMENRIRVWRNENQMTIEKLYNQILQQCRPLHYQYRIAGIGKIIQNQKLMLNQAQVKQGFLVIENIQKNCDTFFIAPDEKKCQGCYKLRKLPYKCECNKVAYCSQRCLQSDKRYHQRMCIFDPKEMVNKKVQIPKIQEQEKIIPKIQEVQLKERIKNDQLQEKKMPPNNPEIQNQLNCFICLELAKDAVETKCCGQILCNSCFLNVKRKMNQCSYCRQINVAAQPSYIIRRIINGMKIKCENGCGESVLNSQKEGHLLICRKRKIMCKLCKNLFQLCQLSSHMDKNHEKNFFNLLVEYHEGENQQPKH